MVSQRPARGGRPAVSVAGGRFRCSFRASDYEDRGMHGRRLVRQLSDLPSPALAAADGTNWEQVAEAAGIGRLSITVAFDSEQAMLGAWDRVAARCSGLSAYRCALEAACEIDATVPARRRHAFTLLGEDSAPTRVTFERVHWLLRRRGHAASPTAEALLAMRAERARMLASGRPASTLLATVAN